MRELLLSFAQSRYIAADGGVSVSLIKNGSVPNGSRPEFFNVANPDVVTGLHEQFRDAGASCLTTNTFGLSFTDVSNDEAFALAGAGACLARGVAGNEMYVFGSLACVESDRIGRLSQALVDGGVDILLSETCTSVDTALSVISQIRQSVGSFPICISFAFRKEKNGSFLLSRDGGETLEQVCESLKELGADAVGVNCGKGLDLYDYNTIIASFREVWPGVIIVRPSAGDMDSDGNYPETPYSFTEAVWGWVRAGANIVGGCCGVTPEFIEPLAQEMETINS